MCESAVAQENAAMNAQIKKDGNRPDNARAAGDSADKTYLDRKPPCPSLGGQAAEKRCFTALRTLRI